VSHAEVSDDLWQEFHTLVNMTSRELGEWLRVQASDAVAEGLPDEDAPPVGQQVLAILGKRRVDLTNEDAQVMESVVATVRAERGPEPEPTAGDDEWRHRLMDLGHDPLKPVGTPG
jgi:hypothetical protein